MRTLTALVDDLFELATIDARTLSLELVEADLSQLIESCVRGLSAEAAARGVHLRADPSVARARCAPAKVERVLYNLVTNALRHTPADGAVAVRVERDATDVTIVVEDTGEGLDGETERRMFERFWRGEQSRSTPGAGLGLAIARGIVELHGGRIWAEGRPGGGARVSFTLPGGTAEPGVGRIVRDPVEVAVEDVAEQRVLGSRTREQRHRRAQLHRVDRAEDLARGPAVELGQDARALLEPRPQDRMREVRTCLLEREIA